MVQISVETNVREALREIGKVERTLRDRIIIEALNKVSLDARDELVDEMERVFDRPTRFTLNSLFIDRANRGRLSADVGIKDFAAKGTPAVKFLAPEVEGGPRRLKRFERALQYAGILPSGMVAIPGRDAPLDRFGNVRGPEINRMLTQLRASPDPLQNETDRSRRRKRRRNRRGIRYFVARRDGRAIGIGRRQGDHEVMLFFFGRPPSYRPLLRFDDIVERTVERNFQRQFDKAARRYLD